MPSVWLGMKPSWFMCLGMGFPNGCSQICPLQNAQDSLSISEVTKHGLKGITGILVLCVIIQL